MNHEIHELELPGFIQGVMLGGDSTMHGAVIAIADGSIHVVTSSMNTSVLLIVCPPHISPLLATAPGLHSALSWALSGQAGVYLRDVEQPLLGDALIPWLHRCRREGDLTDADADRLILRLEAEAEDEAVYE